MKKRFLVALLLEMTRKVMTIASLYKYSVKNELFSYQLFLFSAIKITPPAKRILRMAYFEYLPENCPEIILKEYLQDHDSSVNV